MPSPAPRQEQGVDPAFLQAALDGRLRSSWHSGLEAHAAAASDFLCQQQDDTPLRRLRWDAAAEGEQQEQRRHGGAATYPLEGQLGAEQQDWCAYSLGSPSPGALLPGRAPHGSGGGAGAGLNPLFSFYPRPAGESGQAARAGSGPSAAAPAARVRGFVSHQNELYCEALPPSGPAAAELPSQMPEGQFNSVSALLEALTPGSLAAAAQPGPPQQPPAPGSTSAGGSRGNHAGSRGAAAAASSAPCACPSPGTDAAVEANLNAAVARFFVETAQKAPPPAALLQQRQQQQTTGGARRAAALASIAKRQQAHGARLGGSPAQAIGQEQPEPVLKHGRPNRAADQQQRGGRRGRELTPGPPVCYA